VGESVGTDVETVVVVAAADGVVMGVLPHPVISTMSNKYPIHFLIS
jgi:hypothetical protein